MEIPPKWKFGICYTICQLYKRRDSDLKSGMNAAFLYNFYETGARTALFSLAVKEKVAYNRKSVLSFIFYKLE